MSIRGFPDKPIYREPRNYGRPGPCLGIGMVVFFLVVFGGYVVGIFFLQPFFEDVTPQDTGISPVILLAIFLGTAVIVLIYVLSRGNLLKQTTGVTYKDQDPSICRRVIRDGYDGAELIVTGNIKDTFAQACRTNWQFQSVNQKSKWYIRDTTGNDVTDRFLETADGIFFIIPEYDSETLKEEHDDSDEFSPKNDSTTYYD